MEKRDFYFGLGFMTFVFELALQTLVPSGTNEDKLFKICMIVSVCMMLYKFVTSIFAYIERGRKDGLSDKTKKVK